MNLFEQKKLTVNALQGVSNLIDVVEKSTLNLEDIKDLILVKLKEIEFTLTKNDELISSEIEKYKPEIVKKCIHRNVDHVITDDDHYYECINCGAEFPWLPSEDTVVRKTIKRY